jgi:phage regulator Rha-like protein
MENQIMTMEQQMMNAQTITSIEIAALVGKPHNDMLKAIRKMEPAWEQEHLGKFSQMQIREELPNGGYRLRPCYLLTKTQSLFIATKFNDVARARLVLRWEQLEKEKLGEAPQTFYPQKLLMTEKELLLKSDEIRRHQIVLENASADGCFTACEIAKALDMDVKDLNKELVKKGVQYFNGGRYKLTPEYEGRGLAQDRAFHYYALDGEKKQRFYLVWTQLGAELIKTLID